MPLDQIYEDEKNMSFFDHIEELRSVIVKSVLGILVGGILSFVFKDFVFDKVIFGPINKDFITYKWLCYIQNGKCFDGYSFKIINTDVTGQFVQHLIISFIAGIIISFPYIIYQFWTFVKPALNLKEQRKTTGIIFISSLLFLLGILFGYFLLSPISIFFMADYNLSSQIENTFTLQSYISFLATLTLATGLIFELPLFMYFLAKIGLINVVFLTKYRRYAIVIIVIIAAIITPPDVVSQVLVSLPLLILYEVGIIITKKVEKNNLINGKN